MAIYDIALCNKYTGEVEQIQSVGANTDLLNGQFIGVQRAFYVAPGADFTQILEETYYDYEAEGFLSRGKRPGDFYVWTVNKGWDVDSATLLKRLREQRDGKLYSCDWTQGADSILTDEKIAEWATYRAALRDVPANLPEEFDGLAGFNWPTQPS